MLTEKGVIEKASSRKAVVRVQRSSACDSCESRQACEVRNKDMLVEVTNSLDAKPGDTVEISVPAGSLLRFSLLVYFLPVLALIAGALAGGAWSHSLKINPTLASIICGALAMSISFLVLRAVDRSVGKRKDIAPRMTRILLNASSSQHGDNK